MKHRSFLFLMVLVVFLILFIGCEQQVQIIEDSGTLEIVFTSTIAKNALEPDVIMEVASYSISGVGPTADKTFSLDPVDGQAPVIIQDLYRGPWTVTVVGLNEDGVAIGSGTDTVIIIPRKKTSTKITVTEYSGNGILNLIVDWPSDITDPQILASLTPTTGNDLSVIPLTFVLDDTLGMATFGGNIPMGSLLSGYNSLNSNCLLSESSTSLEI